MIAFYPTRKVGHLLYIVRSKLTSNDGKVIGRNFPANLYRINKNVVIVSGKFDLYEIISSSSCISVPEICNISTVTTPVCYRKIFSIDTKNLITREQHFFSGNSVVIYNVIAMNISINSRNICICMA